jgi:hypothetical protein
LLVSLVCAGLAPEWTKDLPNRRYHAVVACKTG